MKRRWAVFLVMALLLASPVRADGEKYVALTFDDGPSGRYTRRLLEGMQERQVQATFFLCGYRMEQYPDLASQILAGGHEIGNHGYSHGKMSDMDAQTLNRELERTDEILRSQTGISASLLRPPGGSSCQKVVQAARTHGVSLVTWSVDPMDWATEDRALVVKRVMKQVKDGDIILMHDMSDSSVDAALEIIDHLTEQGYRFKTVSQLAAVRDQTMEAGGLYTKFP